MKKKSYYTVFEVVSRLKERVESEFPPLAILGELTRVYTSNRGHLYFAITDGRSSLDCVMFAGYALTLNFSPVNGQLAVVEGTLSVYQAKGSCQLTCESVRLAGRGELLAERERCKERLAREGLFDPSRKKSLPPFPRRLVLITSPRGAAIRDILKVLAEAHPPFHIRILPTAVQGREAVEDLSAALELANKKKLGELIILSRGGGSLEDLQAFSNEKVVREVAASSIPVITGIGHEIDLSLADLAADLHESTPSTAASYLVSQRKDWYLRFRAQSGSLGQKSWQILSSLTSRLNTLYSSWQRQFALEGLDQWQRRLVTAGNAFFKKGHDILRERERLIELLETQLQERSPEKVLARGFVVASHKETGEILLSTEHLQKGDHILIELLKGTAQASITEVKRDEIL